MILAVSAGRAACSRSRTRACSRTRSTSPTARCGRSWSRAPTSLLLDVNRSYAENVASAREFGHTRSPCATGRSTTSSASSTSRTCSSPAVGVAAIGPSVDRAGAAVTSPRTRDRAACSRSSRGRGSTSASSSTSTAAPPGSSRLEDVLEELIGEIQDEFDQEAPKVQTLPDGRLAVDAAFTMDELEGRDRRRGSRRGGRHARRPRPGAARPDRAGRRLDPDRRPEGRGASGCGAADPALASRAARRSRREGRSPGTYGLLERMQARGLRLTGQRKLLAGLLESADGAPRRRGGLPHREEEGPGTSTAPPSTARSTRSRSSA